VSFDFSIFSNNAVLLWQGEKEGASLADFGFDPDFTAVHFNDFLDYRKTDTGALGFVT
jgi:hypothetical protein